MDEDMDRALQRHHLTAKMAGRIAREAGVGELVVTHFSPKYRGAERTPEHEALEEFDRQS
jgi:ribonuclease Z